MNDARPAAFHGAPAADISLLSLGDSYTVGEGVAADERWPVRLSAMLRARGFAAEPPRIVARTGWTTDELSAGLDAARPAGVYDLVTLLIGVNNQYRGRSAEEYRGQFHHLLVRAIGFAGGRADRVIVISIPDWGVTPFAARDEPRDRGRIAAEVDTYNAINRDEAARAGARYVDVTTVSRRAREEHTLLAEDGLHPSGAMYAEWARLILPLAIDALAPADAYGAGGR
jgi:lysophospholipase L1-like esterase